MSDMESIMKTATAVVLSASIALGVGFFAGALVARAPTVGASGADLPMKPAGSPTSYLQAELFEAGSNSIVARPIFPLHTGVAIPIKNTSTTPLTFGRFDLVGAMPAISQVLVPGKTFTAAVEGKRAVTLTGDRIDPNETIEVYIAFVSEASEQGAVLARFNQN